MDIIPFYYQIGQLEALSFTHQWLQGQTADSSPPICTIGLNEAIARERFARSTTQQQLGPTPTTSNTQNINGIMPDNSLLFPLGMPLNADPSPADMPFPSNRFPTTTVPQQTSRTTTSSFTRTSLLNKMNRRRKAAIIARCAASSGGAGGSVLPPSDFTSSSVMPLAITPILSTPIDAATPPKQKRRTASVKSAKNEGTDESDSDEDESDVEVLDLDDQQTFAGMSPLFSNDTERQHNDDPKMAQWRSSFESAITERYRNKCRRRNMLCRRMLEFNLQRLKATEGVDLSQLSLTDLRIREKYAALVDPASNQAMLVHRDTGRVFICLEDMFDILSKFHTERGHGGSRKAMYVEARKRFANVSKEIVREYLRGCEWCTKGKEGNGWGGRRVKAGRSSGGSSARRTPKATAIIDGLALRQYFERMGQKQKQDKEMGNGQSGQ